MEPELKKKHIVESINGNEDRISQLPDPILHLILSCFKTRDAFPTRLLSKRWENLWASMPYFNITRSENDQGEEILNKFLHSVSSVLMLCNQSDIQTFRLQFLPTERNLSSGFKQQHLHTCIDHLVRRNVKTLNIKVLIGEAAEFPSSLFTCRSVEELRLAFEGFKVTLTAAEVIGFSRLKTLRMEHIFADCDSLKNLISGCPVLEDLQLVSCELKGLDISSNSLKTLLIICCKITGSVIQISCPKAHDIDIWRNEVNPLEVRLGNLSSLVRAMIQIDNNDSGQNLRPLKFVTSSNKNYSRDLALDTLCNLRILAIGGRIITENFAAVAYFLKRSPNLELLFFRGVEHDHDSSAEYYYSCDHFEMEIAFEHCREEDRLIEKMEEYFESKCDC